MAVVTLDWLRSEVPSHSAVLVTGGFDPVHYGHTRYIAMARQIAEEEGLCVVIGVAPDEYVARKHPILQILKYRLETMDAIKGVAFVAPQDEETASSIIRAVRPKYFLKGDDWEKRRLPANEIDALTEVGAGVRYTPINPVSSSEMLTKFFWDALSFFPS